MTPRRICVVTVARSDYWLLKELMSEIQADAELTLQVIAAGAHTCPEFGLTYRDIEQDGFSIDRKIDMLLSADTDAGATKSIGVGLMAFADAMDQLRPDILVLLGDRFELLSAAIAALLAKVPIAHIHGGETSQGAVDEAVRHAVTKMASLHFASTEAYRQRIIQLGEDPCAVFTVGAPGLDALRRVKLLTTSEIESRLGFTVDERTAIITYHPVTLERETAASQTRNLLDAVLRQRIRAVFTKANADAQGRLINDMVADFCSGHPTDYRLYDSLGREAYWSCLKHAGLMIGNSSSGIIEAPSFGLPVVNIGDRQLGRVRAANVIDVGYSVAEIEAGIRRAISPAFKEGLKGIKNPYLSDDEGSSSFNIKEQIKSFEITDSVLKKRFHDLQT